MAASSYHVISKEVENHIFRQNWILNKHVCINNPHRQSSGIVICLGKYYITISDKLAGSFLDVLFLFFSVMLSEPHEKPRWKEWVTVKDCFPSSVPIDVLAECPL